MANITADGTPGDDNIQDSHWGNADTVTSHMFAGNDFFAGWSAAYDVWGGEGNDRIQSGSMGGTARGEAGDDTIFMQATGATHYGYGGDGNDRLNPWFGDNPGVSYSYGENGVDWFSDNHEGGSDLFHGGADFDYVEHSGSAGITVSLLAGTGSGGYARGNQYLQIEGLRGTSADDSMTGSGESNVLIGGNGNDMLDGGGGDDLLIGTSQNEGFFRSYTNTRGAFEANPYSMTESAAITPGDAADGADVLRGGSGKDVLIGGLGADHLDGGTNTDAANYVDATGAVTVNLSTGATAGDSALGDTFVSIENLLGSDYGDTLTGNSVANLVRGRGGNDTLSGGAGNDSLVGNSGDDLYIVTDAGDVVSESANDGTDTVHSSVSHTLAEHVEHLVLTGNATRGTGNTQANTLTGNTRNNTLSGSGGDDTLNGGAGNDTLNGGTGNDTQVGDVGNDLYILTDADTIIESAGGGRDTVQSSFTYTLGENLENLVLTGNATRGTGNTQGNELTGNTRANTLVGGDGNDTLAGGTGNDTLTGGTGNDRFLFDTALGGTNRDVIGDFDPVADALRLDDVVFTGLPLGTISSSAFRSGTAAQDSSDRIIYNAATGAVLFDSDGTGANAAVRFATLTPGLAITNSDFIVV